MSIEIEIIPVSPFMQNCRIAFCRKTREALVFDPGDHPQRIFTQLRKKNLKVVAILLTHGHLDHASAVDAVRNEYKCEVYMHKKERPVYESIGASAAAYNLNMPQPSAVDHYLVNDQLLNFLGTEIKVLFTPGHTPGGVCFYFHKEAEPFVIVGDTLFKDSVGRTDLPGGNQNQLIHSIKEQLYKLPDETIVMSGHGPNTSIGHEKRYNSFVRA